MPRGNRLLDPGSGNPLVDQMGGGVTWADAAQQRWQQYQQWVAQQRAEGIARGEIDPATGWPTQAGLVDAARQYGNALLGSTTAPGLRAYHGSPHSFDRFDLSRIGSGEGAQAFGHGLYFAENEGTARAYRDNLSAPYSPVSRGETLDRGEVAAELAKMGVPPSLAPAMAGGAKHAYDTVLYGGGSVAPFNDLKAAISDAYGADHPAIPYVQNLMDKAVSGRNYAGHMYEVAIKADPEAMLDWDKPMSQQSDAVKAALRGENLAKVRQTDAGYVVDYASGGQPKTSRPFPTEEAATNAVGPVTASVRNWAADHADAKGGDYRVPPDVAEALRNAGIPGIRYADAGSRGQEGGTSNYVVFDDKLIDIMRKYGIAGLTAAGIANPFGGQAAADSPPPAQQ